MSSLFYRGRKTENHTWSPSTKKKIAEHKLNYNKNESQKQQKYAFFSNTAAMMMGAKDGEKYGVYLMKYQVYRSYDGREVNATKTGIFTNEGAVVFFAFYKRQFSDASWMGVITREESTEGSRSFKKETDERQPGDDLPRDDRRDVPQ